MEEVEEELKRRNGKVKGEKVEMIEMGKIGSREMKEG